MIPDAVLETWNFSKGYAYRHWPASGIPEVLSLHFTPDWIQLFSIQQFFVTRSSPSFDSISPGKPSHIETRMRFHSSGTAMLAEVVPNASEDEWKAQQSVNIISAHDQGRCHVIPRQSPTGSSRIKSLLP
jgi:hypothetical protein